MNRAELVTTISGCLQDVLKRPLPDVTEQTRLFEDLHLDSTTILELLMAVEETVGVEFDMDALNMDDFQTIATFADSVESISTTHGAGSIAQIGV